MASAILFGNANAGFQGGIINGNVRRETPPLPDIVIPFAQDVDFVKRGTTCDQINRICAVPNSRAALVGLGGVGKSQIAIDNAARFEQSYRNIADRVKITGRQDPQANIFKLVHDWLCCCKQQWLLVLDNVDNARFLLEGQSDVRGQITNASGASRPLREYLPHCELGSILVTTHNKEAAQQLVEKCNIISVEPMDEAQALALFKKKLGVEGDNGSIVELAVALETCRSLLCKPLHTSSEAHPAAQ
ncbi:hypothetical protein CC86DRAFT_464729 [Ophiobolus disseminans]|uniref:NB-ARC domain-containing protein n=1 Tax=Ophiobolus disseminans TaxID=1469910 RepID=A0A6A7A748_9PLEO|nr:hypothetical protein CC86DRAFT_464729 [Ophiobolus disseminans]